MADAFEGHNSEQMVCAESGDHRVVICREGAVGPGRYLDAQTREVVEFDHITRKVTGCFFLIIFFFF